MRLSNLWYLIKQGVKNIFHNSMMSFSCIGVLVACMMLIGSSIFFTLTVNNIVGTVESFNEITVDLVEGASPQIIDEELSKISNIAEITFVSKDEGLKKLTERLSGGESLMEGLKGNENPLPDRYVIRIEQTDKLPRTMSEIAAIKGVEEVQTSEEVSKVLSGIKKTVYYAGVGIVVILVLVSLAIITNTIKITIFSRRREINIMKYVGATDWFIRLPFLVEGVLIGLIAAVISFVFLGIGYPYLITWAQETYGAQLNIVFSNAAQFEDVALQLLGGFSAMGAAIGVLSSTLFVRKHLRV